MGAFLPPSGALPFPSFLGRTACCHSSSPSRREFSERREVNKVQFERRQKPGSTANVSTSVGRCGGRFQCIGSWLGAADWMVIIFEHHSVCVLHQKARHVHKGPRLTSVHPFFSFISSPFLGILVELLCHYNNLGPNGVMANRELLHLLNI